MESEHAAPPQSPHVGTIHTQSLVQEWTLMIVYKNVILIFEPPSLTLTGHCHQQVYNLLNLPPTEETTR